MTIFMIYLVKKQANINTYLTPVNDCTLVINQKYYYKFISSKINNNLRQLLIEKTKNNKILKNEIIIANEFEFSKIIIKQSLDVNMPVEILESNNPFTNEIIDSYSKIVLNAHQPIVNLFIAMGKTIKKIPKNFTEGDIKTVRIWSILSHNIILILDSLDIKKQFNEITF